MIYDIAPYRACDGRMAIQTRIRQSNTTTILNQSFNQIKKGRRRMFSILRMYTLTSTGIS